jgi:hypothetical protein
MFTPLPVVITTTTDQRTFMLTVGQCDYVPNSPCMMSPPAAGCPQAVTSEDDQYYAEPDAPGGMSVAFYADCGHCGFVDGHLQYWCS